MHLNESLLLLSKVRKQKNIKDLLDLKKITVVNLKTKGLSLESTL